MSNEGFGARPGRGAFEPGGFGAPPGSDAYTAPTGGHDPYTPVAAPTATFSDVMRVLRILISRLGPSGVLGAYMVTVALSFAVIVPGFVLGLRVFMADDYLDGFGETLGLTFLLGGLGLIIHLVNVCVRFALFAPMRAAVLHGPEAVGGVAGAFRLAAPTIFPALCVLIVYGVAIGIGTLFCIFPGMVAMVVLHPAVYMVATGRTFGEAFSESLGWAQRHTGAILGATFICLGVNTVAFCCQRMGTLSVFSGDTTLMTVTVLVMPFVRELIWFPEILLLASAGIAVDEVTSEESTPASAAAGVPSTF